jgi:hypothetical protein
MTKKWLQVIACAAAFAAWAQAVEPEVCGYVYNLHGSWRIAPQYAVELRPGMAVHAGEQIQLKSSARPAHLDIGLLNGTVSSRNCNTEQDCKKVEPLCAARHEKTLPERLIRLMSGFSAQQPPPVFTLTRGDGPHPEEAVLRRTRSTVDVAPALRSTASGTWDAALIPAGGGRSIAPVPCRWVTPHGACVLDAPKAGLYTLRLTVGDAAPAAALVLIADESDYDRLAAAFAEATRVADSWGEGVRPATRHYFLSSVLNELALERVP